MKKQIISTLCIIMVVVVVSYILALFKVESKIIWGVSLLVLTCLACATTRKLIKPSTAMFAALAGVLTTHIPWWISHNIKHGISFQDLFGYFIDGTNMYYSIMGVIFGYTLYRLIDLFFNKSSM